MFNITLIREQPELVRTNLKKRKDPNLLKLLDEVIAKDALWRQEKYDLQKCIAERNQISKEIAQYKKQGKTLQGEIGRLNAQIGKLNLQIKAVTLNLQKLDQEIATTQGKISETKGEIDTNKKNLISILQTVHERDGQG